MQKRQHEPAEPVFTEYPGESTLRWVKLTCEACGVEVQTAGDIGDDGQLVRMAAVMMWRSPCFLKDAEPTPEEDAGLVAFTQSLLGRMTGHHEPIEADKNG